MVRGFSSLFVLAVCALASASASAEKASTSKTASTSSATPTETASAPATSTTTDLSVLEARAADQVLATFKAAHLSPPTRDPSLSLAARALAAEVLSGKMSANTLAPAVAPAVSAQGGWDPSPRTLLLGGATPELLISYVKDQAGLTEDKSDVFGVGFAVSAKKSVLLVMTARRYAELSPFPRKLPKGGHAPMEVKLRSPLRTPTLVVTGPDGSAHTNSDVQVDGPKLTAQLTFPMDGRYAVEILGRSTEGPRVAALFDVDVGASTAPVATTDDDPPEPKDPISKVEAVFARINRLRMQEHVQPLVHDHDLDVMALDHAEDMAKNHFFAHVSPTRGDLRHRLEGRYSYVRAGENLGEASGALAAERAIEASPAHRENLLDATFTHVGLALFPNEHVSGTTTLLLVEIFAQPTEALPDPADAILTALNAQRGKQKLGSLKRDEDLDAVAARHLARMLQADAPIGTHELEEEALERTDLEKVAVDVFVGSQPEDAIRSQNLGSKDFNRVGIAALLHSSPKYGTNRLWICVLYGQIVPLR
jgi:uncharacterized protein YkwD